MADDINKDPNGAAKPDTGAAKPEDASKDKPGNGTEVKTPDADKPADSKPSEKKEEPKGPEGAPENGYADFKLPEGMAIDATLNEQFKATSKELSLPQDKAQKLVDLYASHLKAQSDSIASEWQKTKEAWKGETAKAFGADAEKQLALVAKVRDKFGDAELAKFMEDTGVGNHPLVNRFLAKIGAAFSESAFVESKSQHEDKTQAAVLYPDMGKK